ncbi:hypothetical protein Pmani_014759 [Petrolisthes manimaculis]|uniref:Uncharacterized protein n=1 Tax=Petrolisthes manimaculis TaxID=1843537 RepID=A0AAE1PTM6_9EUCA|nr:hypothetical protein Pmani_014759 [Petrolisthes manimaculis]
MTLDFQASGVGVGMGVGEALLATDFNTDLATTLGFVSIPRSPPHRESHHHEPTNLIALATSTTTAPSPHMVMEVFDHLFSEEEKKENPLVHSLRQRLHHVTQTMYDTTATSNSNPAVRVLLVYLVPGVVLTTLLLTGLGVGPGIVGFLALVIPVYIFFSLTNFN